MYSVGSVANLISGSDTPNKKMKIEANTPKKEAAIKTPKKTPAKVKAEKSPKMTPAKVQKENTPKKTPAPKAKTEKSPAKAKPQNSPKNTPAKVKPENSPKKNTPAPKGKTENTPAKAKPVKSPKNTPAKKEQPNKKQNKQKQGANKQNPNKQNEGKKKIPNTPNKPIQSPTQRFQQKQGKPQKPFNRNQQQNGGNMRNQPFNNRNQPFNNRNQRFNNRNQQNGSNNGNGPNFRNNTMNQQQQRTRGVKRNAPSNFSKPIGEKIAKFDSPEKKRRTVFVGNVPLNTTEKEIKQLFNKYGKIESVRFRGIPRADMRESKKVAHIKKNFHPDRKAMIAYVVFVDQDHADKAQEVNGQTFKDHCLRVNLASLKKPNADKQSIFVGNLPFNVEDNDLIAIFKDCGEIHSVRISRDMVTGVGRGFGYVNFKSLDGVELALQMENVKIKDRVLRIKRSDQKKNEKNSVNWISIKIDNIPITTKRSYLMNSFKRCGKIINITFNQKKLNKKFKTALIAFQTANAADNALKLRLSLNNKLLYIRKDSFDPRTHVFIRDLPLTAKNTFIKTALKDCGNIKRCKLLLKPKPPHTTGFGIVEFYTAEEAEKALKLKTIKLQEDIIKIESYINDGKSKRKAETDDDEDDEETEEQQNGEANAEDDNDSDDESMEQDAEEEDDSELEEGDEAEQEEGDDDSDDGGDDDDDNDDDDDDEEDDDDDE